MQPMIDSITRACRYVSADVCNRNERQVSPTLSSSVPYTLAMLFSRQPREFSVFTCYELSRSILYSVYSTVSIVRKIPVLPRLREAATVRKRRQEVDVYQVQKGLVDLRDKGLYVNPYRLYMHFRSTRVL
jgi:hypothetical protein